MVTQAQQARVFSSGQNLTDINIDLIGLTPVSDSNTAIPAILNLLLTF